MLFLCLATHITWGFEDQKDMLDMSSGKKSAIAFIAIVGLIESCRPGFVSAVIQDAMYPQHVCSDIVQFLIPSILQHPYVASIVIVGLGCMGYGTYFLYKKNMHLVVQYYVKQYFAKQETMSVSDTEIIKN